MLLEAMPAIAPSKINTKENPKTKHRGVQHNRHAHLGIGMFIIKLGERESGDVGQI